MSTKITSIIESTASKAMRFHSFAKEWQSAIVAVWLLKIVTAAVSVYAGAHYFSQLIAGAIGGGPAAVGVALLLLFLLETTNATALFKGAKFALRRRPAPAIAALLVASLTFTASYHTSVQGMRAAQTAKAGNTSAVDSTLAAKVSRLEALETSRTAEKQNAIALIQSNPQGWQDGRRSVLTRGQLAEIAALQRGIDLVRSETAKTIMQLEAQANAARAAIGTEAQAEGNQYANVVAVLMAIQLAANILLAFFYSRIFLEREKALADADDLRAFASDLFGGMFADIRNRYAQLQGYFADASAQLFDEAANDAFAGANALSQGVNAQGPSVTQNPANAPANAPLTPPNTAPGQRIGFGAQRTGGQPIAHATQADTQGPTQTDSRNYYYSTRPQLCEAIEAQARGEILTTNRALAARFGCSEATVRNCRRAIL